MHGVLCSVLFVALLQQWWEIWGFRAASSWSFHETLVAQIPELNRWCFPMRTTVQSSYSDAQHSFDSRDDTEETRQVIAETLSFLTQHLRN